MSAGILWMLALTAYISGTWLAHRHLSTVPPHLDAPFGLYPVSVLKPLKGTDPGFESNLESFFRLNYPDFELIFSVASRQDPAIPVVERLIALYPRVRARMIVGERNVGANPKINNLIESYDCAENDLILISDSNVRVLPDYLKRLVAHLDNGVGMVSAAVAGVSADNFPAQLESCGLNTFYARSLFIANALGRPCVVGKSMLFRRSVASRFGGIRNLARYIAEDYMAGEAIRRLGLRVVIAHDAVPQHLGALRFADVWKRYIRWGRLRKMQAPIAFLCEPFLGVFASCVLGAWALPPLFNLPVPAFVLAHLGVAYICDGFLQRRMNPGVRPSLAAWWIRETLVFPAWIQIASGRTVEWRGQKLQLGPGGVLESV